MKRKRTGSRVTAKWRAIRMAPHLALDRELDERLQREADRERHPVNRRRG